LQKLPTWGVKTSATKPLELWNDMEEFMHKHKLKHYSFIESNKLEKGGGIRYDHVNSTA